LSVDFAAGFPSILGVYVSIQSGAGGDKCDGAGDGAGEGGGDGDCDCDGTKST